MLANIRGLQGDEFHYHSISLLMADAVLSFMRGLPVDWTGVLDGVIGRGYAMPGMGILLVPIQVAFGGEAPLYAARAYTLAINLTLIALIVRELGRLGSSRFHATATMLACCAFPFYLAFLSKLWADVVGVHLAILFMLSCERMLIERKLTAKRALALGLILLSAAFVRPQYTFLGVLAALRIVFDWVEQRPRDQSLARQLGVHARTTVLLLLPIVVGLSAWNSALNARFGDAFLITSGKLLPLFDNEDLVAQTFRTQGTLNKYHSVFSEVKTRAEVAGITFSEQADLMAAELPRLELDEWRLYKLRSMGAFYFWENSRLQRILGTPIKHLPNAGLGVRSLLYLNTTLWFSLLAVGLLAFAWPAFPKDGNFLVPLWLKGTAFLIMTQPHLSPTHGRYYAILIPVFMLLVSLTLKHRSERGKEPPAAPLRCLSWIWGGQVFALLYGALVFGCLVYIFTVLHPEHDGLPQ